LESETHKLEGLVSAVAQVPEHEVRDLIQETIAEGSNLKVHSTNVPQVLLNPLLISN
jgi:hypothetical protein